jgi:hypothetical protein
MARCRQATAMHENDAPQLGPTVQEWKSEIRIPKLETNSNIQMTEVHDGL